MYLPVLGTCDSLRHNLGNAIEEYRAATHIAAVTAWSTASAAAVGGVRRRVLEAIHFGVQPCFFMNAWLCRGHDLPSMTSNEPIGMAPCASPFSLARLPLGETAPLKPR